MRQERLEKIEEYVSSNGFVTMEQIRDEFQIAMPTVRKDISELASQGLIEKVYGGAKAITKTGGHLHKFKNRESLHVAEKNTIAAKAAGLIDDGDVIYIDSGNGEFTGQVVCGIKRYGRVLSKPAARIYPDILTDAEKFPSELSCAERSISAPQSIAANVMASTAIVSMLYYLLIDGSLQSTRIAFSTRKNFMKKIA